MHVSLSIMRPNVGHEQELTDSMHRFGAAARLQDGLVYVGTLRGDGDTLFGVALWESREAAAAAGPALMAAVEGDDFEAWVAEMQNFSLDEV